MGGGGSNPSANNGELNLRLKPRSERRDTPEQIIARLRPKMDTIPGIRVYLSNRPLITIGGIQSRSNFQYSLQSPDIAQLYRIAPDFERQVRTLPQLTDVSSDLQNNNPTLTLDIDRDRASALGVTADQIVKEWKDDLKNNPIGAFEVKGHTPPVSTLDIEELSVKNSRRQDAATLYPRDGREDGNKVDVVLRDCLRDLRLGGGEREKFIRPREIECALIRCHEFSGPGQAE